MAHERSAWDEGRRAWKRLSGWFDDAADDSGAALRALADIGLVRHLLDQSELLAVQTARRNRASWAEIATKLGISRQAAWEKWRDLDEESPAAPQPAPDTHDQILGRVVRDVTRRARGTSAVPDVVGMTIDDARDVLLRAGLASVNAEPDDPPVPPDQWRSMVVVRQYPDPGTRLRAGSQVRLWYGRGGGSAGVREPRRPPPPVRAASAEVDIRSVVGE